MFYVRLVTAYHHKNALPAQVTICTYLKARMTTVTIVPHLTDQLSSRAVRSIFIQWNPYAAETESIYDCYIQTMDLRITKYLHYNLSIKVPVVVGDIPYSIKTTSATSGTLTFGNRAQLTGQYSKFQLRRLSMYTINMELNVSSPCAEVVRHELYRESEKIFHHLQEATDVPYCHNYLIPLWNNDNSTTNNDTHLIYSPKVPFMKMLDVVINSEAQMGKLTALAFNWQMGRIFFDR